MNALSEGPSVELKRDWVDGAKRTAVAFANTNGGVIYLGIEDDGSVTGVNDIDISMRKATQAISDGIRPDLVSFVTVEREVLEGKTVVAVHVQRGSNRPYYLADKGIRPAGVYVRSGAASIPASESAILDMIRQSAGDSFENALSLRQDLTFVATESAFLDAGVEFTAASRRTLGMIDPDGRYTNLAWLLSDQCEASTKVAVFADHDKEMFLNRQEFTGSLLLQFTQISEFLRQNNRVASSTGPDMRRVDRYDYSPLVIREALLNMIVHRDYGLSGPALISIFDDRMEFLNFGGLPEGLNRQDMLNGISAQRNPRLANVFYRLRWVEAYGTGIRRIMGDYRGTGLQPEFSISDHSFRLSLPKREPTLPPDGNEAFPVSRREPSTGMARGADNVEDDRRRMVLDYARHAGRITRRQAQDVTGLSQSAAANLLGSLTRQGMLTRVGKGPATSYRLSDGGAEQRKDD